MLRSTSIAVCSAGHAALSAVAVAACTFNLASAETVGDLVLLQVTPAGEFMPNDGRVMDSPPWNINAASAQRVIERFDRSTKPGIGVIDYEHQTLNKEKNGQPAPKAGHMRSLRWVEGKGLFAATSLTPRARQYIADGEYEYFSPVFEYSRETGEILAIHMGALTNDPGITGLQPLSLLAAATAAFIHPPEKTAVNPLLKALLAALGLPETTAEPQAIAALTALGPLNILKAQAEAARTALALPADATGDAVIAACTARAATTQPDPAQFVPVAVVEQLRTDIAALTAQNNARAVDDLVKPALADGRLLPAQEAWARDLGKSSVAQLTSYLATAQPIAALASTQTGGRPPVPAKKDGELSADELAVCTAMGLTPEQYKAGATGVATGATT